MALSIVCAEARVGASQAVQSDSRTSFALECADVRSIHDCAGSDPRRTGPAKNTPKTWKSDHDSADAHDGLRDH